MPRNRVVYARVEDNFSAESLRKIVTRNHPAPAPVKHATRITYNEIQALKDTSTRRGPSSVIGKFFKSIMFWFSPRL